MKDIKNKIFESKQNLCPEVQNEFDKDYAYQSFHIGNSKYKYGFLSFDKNNKFYSVTAFNEDSEYAENFADEFNLDLDELLELKIGESISDESHGPNYIFSIIRIW